MTDQIKNILIVSAVILFLIFIAYTIGSLASYIECKHGRKCKTAEDEDCYPSPCKFSFNAFREPYLAG